MPISLPLSPALNDIYTYGSKTWRWDGTRWNIVYTSILSGSTGPTGATGRIISEQKRYIVTDNQSYTISNLNILPGNISCYSTGSYNITIGSQTASVNNSISKITTTNLANSILISPTVISSNINPLIITFNSGVL